MGKGRRGPAYPCEEVYGLDGLPKGKLLLSPSGSYDAHCSRCPLRVNKKYTAHARLADRCPQGRPLGTLICLLWQGCDGDPGVHRGKLNPETLTFDARRGAREWRVENLSAEFRSHERPPRVTELPHGEPERMC